MSNPSHALPTLAVRCVLTYDGMTTSVHGTCRTMTDDERRAYNIDQKRKRLAEYDHRTDESRQERERYAAEGPQLSVADRKFVGIARRPFIDGFVNQHGLLNLRCDYCNQCNATHFSCERVGCTVNSPQSTACCDKGRLTDVLQPLPELSDELEHLLSINNERSRRFRSDIRASVLAFTSTGASLNEGLSTGGVYTFHISAVMLLARACRGLAFVVQPKK